MKRFYASVGLKIGTIIVTWNTLWSGFMESFRGTKRIFLLLSALLFAAPIYASSFLETVYEKALFKLQPHKKAMLATYADSPFTSASLINLNSNFNTWYILSLTNKRNKRTNYNILAVDGNLKLRLDAESPELLIGHPSNTYRCNIEDEITSKYIKRKREKFSYLPACNNLLFVVIKQDGFRSMVERGAEILRWLGGDAGEDIITGVKGTLFKDKYLVEGKAGVLAETYSVDNGDAVLSRAAVGDRYQYSTLPAHSMGLKTQSSEKRLLAGQWYPLKNFPKVYASLMMPGMVSRDIQSSHRDRANRLDGVENNALVYLMAVSLGEYSLGWGHGTDHPGVGWSPRARLVKRDNPYGPDGFNSMNPLTTLGHVPPMHWSNTIGTFSGGFQKRHGAFRRGELAKTNKGHHYGFMQDGVMLVSPSENLATVIMYWDGKVDMKRWTAQDNKKLHLMRHIRQNGVPLIHRNENGIGIPGELVRHWGAGNWSGTAEAQLRAPRGGACLIQTPKEDYLVYAYFSAVTPSGMARVFQAYGCSFALHLDMNSPGQAYASLFSPKEDNGGLLDIELLMTDMYAYMGGNKKSPRYFIKPDYKDFFYIMKKE
jgi:hypothetical protein